MGIENEQEIAAENEFEKSGGLILEKYFDGRPKKWLCGHDPRSGEPTDPPGMRRKATRYLNKDGRWEAGNPDQKLKEEEKMWSIH